LQLLGYAIGHTKKIQMQVKRLSHSIHKILKFKKKSSQVYMQNILLSIV
jgi:hypothetical protein